MKYIDEQGEPISGFYDLNLELLETNKKSTRICMNPACEGITYLKPNERPQIFLGRACWNCHSSEYLKPMSNL